MSSFIDGVRFDSLTVKKDDIKKNDEIFKAAKGFESILVQSMFEEMQKSVPESGLLDSGFAQDVHASMFAQKIAEQSSGNMGIANSIYKQFSEGVKTQVPTVYGDLKLGVNYE